MKKLFLSIMVPLSLIVTGSRVESKDLNIKIECRGKVYLKENSSNWGSEKNSVNDVVRVYTFGDMSTIQGKSDWWFDSGYSVYSNTKSSDPNQPGNPYWYRFISVTNDDISIVISGGNDFEKNKKSNDDTNQKHEYRREIRINRITGEWT